MVRLQANLFILGDFGLHILDNFARETLLDIIDDQYNKTSTIVTW